MRQNKRSNWKREAPRVLYGGIIQWLEEDKGIVLEDKAFKQKSDGYTLLELKTYKQVKEVLRLLNEVIEKPLPF